MIDPKYHGPHPTTAKLQIIMTSAPKSNMRMCVIFCHITSNVEKWLTIFVSNSYYLCFILLFLLMLSIESIQLNHHTHWEHTNRRWNRIQYQFFIKYILTSLIFCMIKKHRFIWYKYLINPSIIDRFKCINIQKGELQFKLIM